MPRRLLRACASLFLAIGLAACSGVPLRSLPRVMSLPETLVEMDPAQFRLAIQVDARVAPPAEAVPVMHLSLYPREAGAFATVQASLPMQFTSVAEAAGLPPAPARRRWLLYRFAPEARAKLERLQASFKRQRAGGDAAGSLAVGIAQEGVAARDPALADTRWETWMQTAARDGYFEVWSGTIAELLRQAMEARQRP